MYGLDEVLIGTRLGLMAGSKPFHGGILPLGGTRKWEGIGSCLISAFLFMADLNKFFYQMEALALFSNFHRIPRDETEEYVLRERESAGGRGGGM